MIHAEDIYDQFTIISSTKVMILLISITITLNSIYIPINNMIQRIITHVMLNILIHK